MAESRYILGQLDSVAGSLTSLYTVPSNAQTVISSLVICNQNSQPDNFYVSVAVNGAADTPAQYLYWKVPVGGYDTFVATIGITLGDNDVLRVMSDNGFLVFNLFGSEVS